MGKSRREKKKIEYGAKNKTGGMFSRGGKKQEKKKRVPWTAQGIRVNLKKKKISRARSQKGLFPKAAKKADQYRGVGAS